VREEEWVRGGAGVGLGGTGHSTLRMVRCAAAGGQVSVKCGCVGESAHRSPAHVLTWSRWADGCEETGERGGGLNHNM
jgi:hypothetical protein